MTAEAIVMNKSAIAMAADSAVTISGGPRGIKTYDTVNKLFELAKGHPVGVMVYANAELNGIPWETIIKGYRQDRNNKSMPHLEDYVDDLKSYIESNVRMFPPETDSYTITNGAYNALLPIFKYFDDNKEKCIQSTGRVVKSRVKSIITEAIELAEQRLDGHDDSAWAIEVGIDKIRQYCEPQVSKLVRDLFAKMPLPGSLINRLVDIALNYLTKHVHDPAETGVVVAGFGDLEYLPSSYEVTLRGRFDNHLMSLDGERAQISVADSAHVQTFAQDEAARAYLSGAASAVRARIIDFWAERMESAREEALRIALSVDGISHESAEALADALSQDADRNIRRFFDEMQDHQDHELLAPIWESIALLPKDELALVAESLVNLTSLKQRMSVHEAQTVGGAIDVALISKGDGFVWLKRKHYFPAELNPSWALTRGAILNTG
ncbi:hypothetical protein [Amycolatopsis magusensis]|uniref:hypothetical protein n=1 Tax=Amycolatopsis magusensis TaxID=882444 RepID=UPI003C2F2EFB